MMKWTLVIGFAALAGCETSTDPADGGFFNGISGISSGTYQQQIDAQEADVAAAQTRNAELSAQIRGSETELAGLKATIAKQRSSIGRTDTATSNRINRVLASNPSGRSDAERLAALQKSITDARALSEDLAQLSG